jgi:uncharacterized repeat protein (TIGR03803 family)
VYRIDSTGKETVLYNFTGGTDGLYPSSGVIRDSTGNLYGTAAGGSGGYGVIYKLDTTGHETVLYSFTGKTDGGSPNGVIRDSAGNLYGTASFGGSMVAGVVYKVDAAGQETVLYNFSGGADGGVPLAGVIRDSAGNFYGTATSGGSAGWGVVYKVDPTGNETVLYSFQDAADGGYPYNAGVIRDSAGNLYGTTASGGSGFSGVVYELDPAGNETVLYSFAGGSDGGFPRSGVIRDSAGNLYGTAQDGGTKLSGVVFRIP